MLFKARLYSNKKANRFYKKCFEESKTIGALQSKVDKLKNFSRRKRIDVLTEQSNQKNQQTHQKVKKIFERKMTVANYQYRNSTQIVEVPRRSTLRTIIAKL